MSKNRKDKNEAALENVVKSIDDLCEKYARFGSGADGIDATHLELSTGQILDILETPTIVHAKQKAALLQQLYESLSRLIDQSETTGSEDLIDHMKKHRRQMEQLFPKADQNVRTLRDPERPTSEADTRTEATTTDSAVVSIVEQMEKMVDQIPSNAGESEISASSSFFNEPEYRLKPVILNVYDVHWFRYGAEMYHSGIEINGVEYSYAAHPYPETGVIEHTPRDSKNLGDFVFRKSVLLGRTKYSDEEIRRIVENLKREFRGDQYHEVLQNCNHFSSVFSKKLCGKDIPEWIHQSASSIGRTSFFNCTLPVERLRLPKIPLPRNELFASLNTNSQVSAAADDSSIQVGEIQVVRVNDGGILALNDPSPQNLSESSLHTAAGEHQRRNVLYVNQ